MENIFTDLSHIEEDSKHLENIRRLQRVFHDVQEKYRNDYTTSLNHSISYVEEKLKANPKMREAVNIFIDKYVKDNKDNAREELYRMLSAEMLHVIQTMQHVSCIIL